jgi:hypothetical protein
LRALIIGSVAMKHNFGDEWHRKPKDFDVFTDELDPATFLGDKTDDLRMEPFWHPKLEPFVDDIALAGIATPDELYTIKVSHSQWDLRNGSWEKHIEDAMWLKRRGAQLEWDFYLALMEIWKEVHGPKKVNLTQDADAFFDDAVKRTYDHDSVHYSVAYGDRPMYETVMDGNAEVAMDMKVIKALPFEEQVKLYREEIYATALERWVIPMNYRCSPRWAYARALKKTIVSLTKGWSSRFLIENYDEFRKPDFDYVVRHRSRMHLLIPLEGKN